MRLLICGDRDWENYEKIDKEIRKAQMSAGPMSLLVISGGARGADTIARSVCDDRGIPFCEFPAPWSMYGRRAGPMRNGWMLKFGKPDMVIAFHSNIEESKGTKNMVQQARKKKLPVRVIQ